MRTRRTILSHVERRALDEWESARPVTAMTTLASYGYNRDDRFRFLAQVVGLDNEQAIDFSASRYVDQQS